MKHIKPGRGPSMISGFTGLFMIAFGIVWTIMAGKASPMFALFGVFWTGIAIVTTIYNFKNATGKKRYSSFDITDSTEEADSKTMHMMNTDIVHIVEQRWKMTIDSAVTVEKNFDN